MKILVFEYITGGGFCNQDFPGSLLEEGSIMLRSLVEDLLRVDDVELYVPLDRRLYGKGLLPLSDKLHIVEVIEGNKTEEILAELLAECEAAWPVAPESDNVLYGICKLVENHEKRLLSSSAFATEITGNKFSTYHHLNRFNIPAVYTEILSDEADYSDGEWVLKPVDGVGCEGSYLIKKQQDFQQACLSFSNRSNYVIQPYVHGENLSLSCLFKDSRGWLLCCNRQEIIIEQNGFLLTGCLVNITKDHNGKYRKLVEKVAKAFPGLWGYAGIDFIESKQGVQVLEINPRLTTSYAGLSEALGINVAEKVLQLIDGDPDLSMIRCQSIQVTIPGKQVNA